MPYQYVDTTGALKTTNDQASTPGIAPNSGIQTLPVNSSTIKPTSSLDVPTYNPVQAPDLKTIEAQYEKTSSGEKKAQSEIDKRLAGIQDIYTHSGSQSAFKANAEQQAGLPDLNKQLNEINTQIRAYTTQAQQAKVNAEDRQAPMFAITGEQASVDRQLSAKTFGLAAAAQALQGNIALAKDNVQRAIDTEFGADQSKIDYQKLLLEKNYDSLTKEEKKKADQTKLALDERQRLLDAQKQDKKDVFDVLTEAATNQAPNAVLQAIQAATTPQAAVLAAGRYMAKPKAVTGGGTPIGKGTPSGFTQADVKAGDQILRTGKDSAGNVVGNPVGPDGYIDPTSYVTLFNHWIQNQGTRDSFFSYYPVDRYINPANTWVWDSLGITNPNLQAGYKGTVVTPKSGTRSL